MRIDHHAYARATKVAGFGLLIQIVIGVLLLIFGMISDDSVFRFASYYVLPGVLVWLGLIIVFHQHKLERLEALEEDELAATRGGTRTESGSVFDRAAEETHVAARRLGLMHKWVMPGLSLVIALTLGGLAFWLIQTMRGVSTGATTFSMTNERGWAVAICLSIAAVSFIFSRFVAGMAKQTAWQNLRGGAAYMVGNSLVMVAVAVGIIFRFFEKPEALQWIAWGIPIFMGLQALEILLNFILNLYRPRIPGEVPRPAFDSRVLSWFASPDSIVRSLNEAVNYQFGFDVTSSWGYQLLLRSFASLAILGVVALVALSTMVVVEPHQQAVRLRGGRVIGDRVHDSGILWKWPWPIETAAVYNVSRVRSLHLTARVTDNRPVFLWKDEEPPQTDVKLEPFVVGSPRLDVDIDEAQIEAAQRALPAADEGEEGAAPASVAAVQQAQEEDAAAAAVSALYSLVDAEIVLEYRIKEGGNGLLDYLRFAPETVGRLQTLTMREQALKALALAEVSGHLARLPLDDVLSPGRTDLTNDLRDKVQAAFDERTTGVEVVAITIPMLRPSGSAAPKFEELGISAQVRQQAALIAERNAVTTFAYEIGNAVLADQVLSAIDEHDRLKASLSDEAPEVIAQRQKVEALLARGGGNQAQEIIRAERDRWVNLMTKRMQASRVQGQIETYRAAPELYRQRELMRMYALVLPTIDKYIIAIDPSRIDVNIDLKKIISNLDFAGASEEQK